jgi:hypothetical protein
MSEGGNKEDLRTLLGASSLSLEGVQIVSA